MNISSTERRRNDKTRWWFAATAVVDYLGQAIHVVDGPTVVASFCFFWPLQRQNEEQRKRARQTDTKSKASLFFAAATDNYIFLFLFRTASPGGFVSID